MLDLTVLFNEADAPIKVKLEDPDLPDLPTLLLRIPDAKTRGRLWGRYYKPTMTLESANTNKSSPIQEMGMVTDDLGYALEMIPYVEGWEGVKQPYSPDLLKKLFLSFERVGRAFATGLQRVFREVEEQRLKKASILEKNS